MLDLTLARLAQQEREQEIARRHRVRAVREAMAPCRTETFVPPARTGSVASGLRAAADRGGLL